MQSEGVHIWKTCDIKIETHYLRDLGSDSGKIVYKYMVKTTRLLFLRHIVYKKVYTVFPPYCIKTDHIIRYNIPLALQVISYFIMW